MHLLKPDGRLPALGDDCGLRLFTRPAGPVSTAHGRCRRAVLSGRGDMATVAGPPDEDAFWFLGRTGIDALRDATRVPQSEAGLRVYADAGHAIVRSTWQPDASVFTPRLRAHGLRRLPGTRA